MSTAIDPDLALIHPGEVLLEDFLKPMEISQYRLAKSIRVDPMRISEIVNGKRSISADTALRFGLFFGTEAQFWMNLQAHYDLESVSIAHGAQIAEDVTPLQMTAS